MPIAHGASTRGKEPLIVRQLKTALIRHGHGYDLGLSEREMQIVERLLGLPLPPDLRALLRWIVPVGGKFPDWRNVGSRMMRERLAWPIEGICLDVEMEDFWLHSWGPRPAARAKAVAVARAALEKAPVLLPVFAHRFIPSTGAQGMPVFSIWQSDVRVFGATLRDFFAEDFGMMRLVCEPAVAVEVPVWSELARAREGRTETAERGLIGRAAGLPGLKVRAELPA